MQTLAEKVPAGGFTFHGSAVGAVVAGQLQLLLKLVLKAGQVCIQPADVFVHL